MILTLYLSQEVIGGALVIVPHADFKGLLSQLNTQVKIQVTPPPLYRPPGCVYNPIPAPGGCFCR